MAHAVSSQISAALVAQQHDCVWTVQSTGKIDFLEILSGCARASVACADVGLRVGQPIDLVIGFDLLTTEGRTKAWSIIEKQAPTHIFLAPVCTPWSVMQFLNNAENVKEEQEKLKPTLEFVKEVCLYQISQGLFFAVEHPKSSRTRYQSDIGEVLRGLVDPVSKLPDTKGMTNHARLSWWSTSSSFSQMQSHS